MPGSTNFLQWNPGKANQETDSAYATDPQRAGGAPVGAAFPSATANKLFYQSSTGVAALMQMLATKGFVVSDANYSTLCSVLSAILTTADQRGPIANVAYASTITLDATKYDAYAFPLGGNTTLVVNGLAPGQRLTLFVVQDASGGHTITYPGNFVGVPQPSSTPSGVSIIPLIAGWSGDGRVYSAGPEMTLAGSIENAPIGLYNASSGAFTSCMAGYLQAWGSSPGSSQGAFVLWNGPGPAGFGGTLFYNRQGGGTGGFEWYNSGGSQAYPGTLLMYLDPNGNLVVGDLVYANGGMPGTSDSSNILPSTAWVQSVFSSKVASTGHNANGYWYKDPATGFIRQWGYTNADINNSTLPITFPLSSGAGGFQTASSISVVATTVGAVSFDRIIYIISGSVGVNGFTVANNGSGGYGYWQAEGF